MAFATFFQAFLSWSSPSYKGVSLSTTALSSSSSSSFSKGSKIPKSGRRVVDQVLTEEESEKSIQLNKNHKEGAEELQQPASSSCGLFYFLHVGKNGGTSVSKWMKKLTKANRNELEFYNWWHQSNNTQFDWTVDFNDIDTKLRSGYITTSTSSSSSYNNSNNKKKWLMVHHHHGSPGLRYMMPKLREWKQLLENQGCDLVLTTTLRDPLSRVKSVVQYRNLPKDEFYSYFEGTGYSSQTSYLLYNRHVKNLPPEFTGRQQKQQQASSSSLSFSEGEVVVVDEIVNYLKEFDIVGRTEQLDDFISDAETITGFDQLQHTKGLVKGKALKSNKSHASYNISSEMKDYLKPHLTLDELLLERIFVLDGE